MRTGASAGPARRRGAWLEIDLAAIGHNVGVIAELVGPGVGIAPVIKADAYGHGLTAVGRSLDGNVTALCVATLDEGLALRGAGVRGRVILLYPVPGPALPEAIEARLEVTLMSRADAADVERAARSGAGRTAAGPIMVQPAVETGLHRGGLAPGEVVGVIGELSRHADIRLTGLWSHLASPHDDDQSARQAALLDAVGEALGVAGLAVPPRHIAASGGIFAGTGPGYEMVRPGLAVYGHLDPALPLSSRGHAASSRLRPALSLKARAVAVSEVPAGGRVGYGGAWQAPRPSRIATLPVGYGDGFARDSQPGATVLVQGRRVPVVGIISMDAVAVDITDVPAIGGEDEFVLVGEQDGQHLSVSDLAHSRNTISWEVLSGMAARLERVYHPDAG